MLLICAFILISTVHAQDITYKYTDAYEEIWNDKNSGGKHDVSIWQPKTTTGYCRLGDVAVGSYDRPTTQAILVSSNNQAVKSPVGFTKIWADHGSGALWDVTFYKMQPPSGYTCLGDIAVRSHSTHGYCCVKNDYIVNGNLDWTYDDEKTGAHTDFSIWTVENAGNDGLSGENFRSVSTHNKPQFGGYLLAEDGVKVVPARK